jgi:hypothetical protein
VYGPSLVLLVVADLRVLSTYEDRLLTSTFFESTSISSWVCFITIDEFT